MTLWDRVERWREIAAANDKEPGVDGDDFRTCAAELEADLRELREALDKLIEAGHVMAHSELWPPLKAHSQTWDAARCALEARIGRTP